MRRFWADYCRAYKDCSDWLAGWFVPWHWHVCLARQLRDLRLNPPKEA